MFKVLGITNNTVFNGQDFDIDKVCISYDWNKINKTIQDEKNKAETWLKRAIEQPLNVHHSNMISNMILTEQFLLKQKAYRNDTVLSYLLNKRDIKIKYFKYRILSKILWGERRKHYLYKKRQYKNRINFYERIISYNFR